MVVRSNIPALNSHRNLGINNSNLARNLERLSSGFRINRAADDAAGLAISERMRGQIRGLAMAEQNVSAGINLIQTAEGGLQETQNLLQRMRELAVMASNGTFTDGDRAQIHHEIVALADEIDRIASSTHYNGINLLDGTLGSVNASNYDNALGLDLNTLDFVGAGTTAMERLSQATDTNVQIFVTEVFGTDVTTGAQTSELVIAMQIGDRTYMGEQAIEMATNFEFEASANPASQGAANDLAAALNEIAIANGAGRIVNDGTTSELGGTITVAAAAGNWFAAATGGAEHIANRETVLAQLEVALAEWGSFRDEDGDLFAGAYTFATTNTAATPADITALVSQFIAENAITADAGTMTALQDAVNGIGALAGTLTIDANGVITTGSIALAAAGIGGITDAANLGLSNGVDSLNEALRDLLGADAPQLADHVFGDTVGDIAAQLTGILEGLGGVDNDLAADVLALLNNTATTGIAGITSTVLNAEWDGTDPDFANYIEAAILDLADGMTFRDATALAEALRTAGLGDLDFESMFDQAGVTFRDIDGTAVATVEFNEDGGLGGLTAGVISNLVLIEGQLHAGTARMAERDAATSELVFQIGANGGADQRAGLAIRNMSTSALGTIDAQGRAWTVRQLANSFALDHEAMDSVNHDASILWRDGANIGIDVLDAALDQVSSQRAQLGALQNRLESTLNSLGVARENLTAAESTIRDVDMAAEMMQFTQNNILTQAAQAMLAQANQLPQGVLQLLG